MSSIGGYGVGAVVAIVCALVWALIISYTGYELGILAWIVGGAIGFGVSVMDEMANPLSGLIAVVFTILAICGGKVVGVTWAMDREIDSMAATELNQAAYDIYVSEAETFAAIPVKDDAAIKQYMFDNQYTEAPSADQVTQEDVQWFKNNTQPKLEKTAQNPPGFQKWKEDQLKFVKDLAGQMYPMTDRLKDSLGLMDIIFFLLGIATAFKVAAGGSEE